jgi:hypothetical protein
MMTFLTLRIEILNLNFCGAVRLPGGGQRWGGWNGIGGWMELTACFASLLASHGFHRQFSLLSVPLLVKCETTLSHMLPTVLLTFVGNK